MIDRLIITDTHFGVKNNSIRFLNNQMRIFEDLRYMIDNNPNSRMDIVHMGDLFDSRSTISIYVFNQVKELFIDLYNRLIARDPNNTIIFLAGNHDFFAQNSDEINTLDSMMSSILPYCTFVTTGSIEMNGAIYVPWYDAEDPNKFKEVLNQYPDADVVFTHTDLSRCNHDLSFLKVCEKVVLSGHIHKSKSYEYKHSQLYNLCPPYSINFNDAGDINKGIWLYNMRGELSLFKNTRSIMFWNVYNEEIFDISDVNIERGDNYNIYINKDNLSIDKYINKLKELSSRIMFCNIIPISESMVEENAEYDINIDSIIYKLLGEELQDNFDTIKKIAEEVS